MWQVFKTTYVLDDKDNAATHTDWRNLSNLENVWAKGPLDLSIRR